MPRCHWKAIGVGHLALPRLGAVLRQGLSPLDLTDVWTLRFQAVCTLGSGSRKTGLLSRGWPGFQLWCPEFAPEYGGIGLQYTGGYLLFKTLAE